MKKLILIATAALFLFQSCAQRKNIKEETTTYYLIRHAEKDRSDQNNRNPNLTEEGLQRAENWAKHFKDVKFDEVYSTDYNRTMQTATPTAKANNLTIQLYDPNNMNIEDFMMKTKGKTVLIVGHSDTTPKVTNALLDEEKYGDIADNNNANLYMVTVSKNSKIAKVSLVTMSD